MTATTTMSFNAPLPPAGRDIGPLGAIKKDRAQYRAQL
jgi:hypothetical protein